MKRYRVHLLLTLTFVAIMSVLTIGRVFLESRDHYSKGISSLEEDDIYTATIHFGRAAEWYFPGNPYVFRSLQGLWRAGRRAEAVGEVDVALKAYYTLKGSLNGTRGLNRPHKEWVERCNQRIADLTVVRHPHISEETVLSDLQKPLEPSVVWAVLVVLGFWGWIGSGLGFIWFSFDGSGGMDGRKAAIWGAVWAGAFAVWVLGMLQA